MSLNSSYDYRDRGRGSRVGRGGRGGGGRTGGSGLMPVCKFFLQGRCYYGDTCRFRHITQEEVQTGMLAGSGGGGSQPMCTKVKSNQNQSNNSTSSNKAVREFDEFKAGAIHIAKRAQDLEHRVYPSISGAFYSIDVECVAIGYGHSEKQRYPGRVSLVKDELDENGEVNEDVYEVILDEIVYLNGLEIISYMTSLTGLTAEKCLDSKNSRSLEDVRKLIKENLPSDAVLVGHSIEHDIGWLGLEKGVDFKGSFDTSIIFRQRLPKNLNSAGNIVEKIRAGEEEAPQLAYLMHTNVLDAVIPPSTSNVASVDSISIPAQNTRNNDQVELDGSLDENLPFDTRYRTFSLRHCCVNLLGVDIQETSHNPVLDARYSLLLFHQYRHSPPEMLRAVRDGLHRSPPTPSFASANPLVNGVCMSSASYHVKWSGRFIWLWWSKVKNRKS